MKPLRYFYITSIVFALLSVITHAQVPVSMPRNNNDSGLSAQVHSWMQSNNGLSFIENKGQIADLNGKALSNLLFVLSTAGVNMYVTNTGLSYVFIKTKKHKRVNQLLSKGRFGRSALFKDSITMQYCRADMDLSGADIRKENIIKEGESIDRKDYYLGGVCPDGALNVHSYGKITIKDVYPGIDWVLYTGDKGLKYDFAVHPGADPSLIKLKYKWTDKPELQNDGSLKVSTPMGNIVEGTPISYTGDGKNKVQSAYEIKGNEVKFKVSKYNINETLTIDPSLVWATYYAGGNNIYEDAYSMNEDGKSVWVCGGEINTTVVFPTQNPGGGTYFQGTTTAPDGIALIMQFTVAGVLNWATYYGGSGTSSYGDFALSIQSDSKNVWVTGETISKNFPTFDPGNGAYFQGAIGGTSAPNAFVLQFNTSGVRKWATYYGGSSYEQGSSIQSDGRNVWVTGFSASTNLPTFDPGGGAYFQGSPGTAYGTAFILDFDTSGVCKWATYYGGNGKGSSGGQYFGDMGNSIFSDGTNVWITGETTSTNFPTVNPGGGSYFQGTLGSTKGNAFIGEFSINGICKWSTYYGGSGLGNSYFPGDVGYSIYSDGSNVWVTGQTTSTNFPTLNPGGGAYYQSVIGSTYGNAFILQFNVIGLLRWATYYGGLSVNSPQYPGDIGYSIQSDGKSVWVCGSATSGDFPVHKSSGCNSFFQGPGGGQDIFILQFDLYGVIEWATLYGVDSEDDESCISSDGTNVFVAGDALSNSYPTENPGGGAYYLSSLQGEENVIVGKFCISCSSFNINAPAVICNGDSTVLSISGGTIYAWSTGATTSSVRVAPATTTTYTVSVSNGTCLLDTSIIVKVNSKPIAIISGPDTICAGSSTNLTASGGPAYLWNTGATTSSINVTPTMTTTYTVGINNGICKSDTTKVVIVNALPIVSITGINTLCNGGTTTLVASGGSSYLWSTGSTKDSITVSPNITTTYTVGVSNGFCVKDTSIIVSVNTNLIPVISGIDTICVGGGTTLIASGGATYLWNTGATSSSITVFPLATSTYSVTVTNGVCKGDTSAVVTVNLLPVAAISGVDTICQGVKTILTASGGSSYKWNTGATTSAINVSPGNTTTYSVTVTKLGCMKDTSLVITVNTLPVPNISGINNICEGDKTLLTATGGSAYTWNTGATTSSINVSPINTSTYTVNVSNGTCNSDTNIVVTVNMLPVAVISGTDTLCMGNRALLTASGGTSYIWNTGATTSSINVSPSSSVTYSVSVSNGICKKDTSLAIAVIPNPTILIISADTICAGSSVLLLAFGANSYSWSPSTGLDSINISTPIANPITTITYTVTGTTDGCEGKGTVIVLVNYCDSLFVPNVFTPNGDGLNDQFVITAEGFKSYRIEIFNRWGVKEFESDTPANAWNGENSNGVMQSDGVYYYVISYSRYSGQNFQKEGFVQLIR